MQRVLSVLLRNSNSLDRTHKDVNWLLQHHRLDQRCQCVCQVFYCQELIPDCLVCIVIQIQDNGLETYSFFLFLKASFDHLIWYFSQWNAELCPEKLLILTVNVDAGTNFSIFFSHRVGPMRGPRRQGILWQLTIGAVTYSNSKPWAKFRTWLLFCCNVCNVCLNRKKLKLSWLFVRWSWLF